MNLAIDWTHLGQVTFDGTELRLPVPPSEPGVYRFCFQTGSVAAEYVGEATSLPSRFGTYTSARGGPGTNTRMRTRMERTLTEGDGTIEVFIAKPVLEGVELLDLSNKLIRVFVEHAAATSALVDGRPLLNGTGYPPMPVGSVLSGSRSET